MTFTEIMRMGVWEYNERMKAVQLRDLDAVQRSYLTAWAGRLLNACDKDGKYIYQSLTDLFDYEDIEKEILGIKKAEQHSRLKELKERSDRAQMAREKAKKILEERRMNHVNE